MRNEKKGRGMGGMDGRSEKWAVLSGERIPFALDNSVRREWRGGRVEGSSGAVMGLAASRPSLPPQPLGPSPIPLPGLLPLTLPGLPLPYTPPPKPRVTLPMVTLAAI